MNDSQVNGADLNGPGTTGNNASLTGGVSISSSLVALLVSSAILTGGLSSLSEYHGAVSTELQGGINSISDTGGIQRVSASNNGGIYSEGFLTGTMEFEPSLRNGVSSPSMLSASLLSSPRLQPGFQEGFQSIVGGSLSRGVGLNKGISKTGYIGGGISGGIVLMADGVKSTSQLSSPDLFIGLQLKGGFNSTHQVGGKYKYPAYLTGGFLANSLLGKEIDISALLQGAIYSVGSVGGTYKTDSYGNDGIQNTSSLFGAIKASPTMNSGVASSATLSSKYRINSFLDEGFGTSSFIGGNGIITKIFLTGGLSSDQASFDSGQIRVHDKLQGGLTSFSRIGGDVVLAFVDPLLNTWALEIRSATVLLEILHPTSDI